MIRGQCGSLAAGRRPSAGFGIGGGYGPVYTPVRRRLTAVVHGHGVVSVVYADVRPCDSSQRQRAARPRTVAFGLRREAEVEEKQ